MKRLIVGICFVSTQIATAQTPCIPRNFAEEDVATSYAEMSDTKRAELAAVQKEYAEFAEQVRAKKGRDNRIELTNAFVDAAAAAYLIHGGIKIFKIKEVSSILFSNTNFGVTLGATGDVATAIEMLDDGQKQKLQKILGKNYKQKVIDLQKKLINKADDLEDVISTAEQDGLGGTIKRFFKSRPEKFKNWVASLKEMAFGSQVKEIVAASAKKLGLTSTILAIPLGVYVTIAKIKEQQRLVQLTAEQDKVMKQALLLELFLNQKSFAELAATRAKLHPDKVCPAST